MIITFLGHSAVLIEAAGAKLLIDPFLDENPLAAARSTELDPDYILLTHAHGDHVGDTVAIATRSGAKLLAPVEIVRYLAKRGVDGIGMNIGGARSFPFGTVRFTPAWHSSSFDDGTYGGMPTGVVLEAEGKRIYHAGDTALFGDMQLIGSPGLDLAFLPIGGNFTMDPSDAAAAARLLSPTRVVPIHYDTFPPIRQDPEAFLRLLQEDGESEGLALRPGERVEL